MATWKVRSARWLVVLGALLGSACGGGGGDGGTPGPFGPLAVGEGGVNDLPTDPGVVLLAAAEAGNGTVGPGDVSDVWAIAPALGQTIQIEIQGVRRDQATWNTAAATPRLELLGPAPLYTILLDHDPALFAPGPARDLDIDCYRVTVAGTHYVRVSNSGGMAAAYCVAMRVVSPLLPIQLESEPNDTAPTADAIVPGTMYASFTDNELDFFSFSLVQESEVCFEVIAQRGGIHIPVSAAYLDPRAHILDAGGGAFVPAILQDDVFNHDPGVCERLGPGNYRLLIDEFPGTTASGEYCIRYTRRDVPIVVTEDDSGHPIAPNNDTIPAADSNPYGFSSRGTADLADVDFYEFFGTAGDMVRVQWYDLSNCQASVDHVDVRITDAGGTLLPAATPVGPLQTQRTILRTTGNHYVKVTGLGVLTDYSFHLERVTSALLESEPNDTRPTADEFAVNRVASGVIDPAPDVDFFRIPAFAGEVVTIDVYASSGFYDPTEDEFDDHGSTLNPKLVIHDSVGPIVPSALVTRSPPVGGGGSAQSLADPLPTCAVTFIAPSTGDFWVEVSSEPPVVGGPDARYVIQRR